jgi:hypothetical protein
MRLVPITEVNSNLIEDFTCLFSSYEKHESKLKSDHEEIDGFLKEEALVYHKNNLVRTHILLNDLEDKVIGFFFLFNEDFLISTKKGNSLKFKQVSVYRGANNDITDIPAIRLHKFAVHKDFQGKKFMEIKYSDYLFNDMLDSIATAASWSGCMFITLEATDNAFEYYKNREFKVLNKKDGNTLPYMVYKVLDI